VLLLAPVAEESAATGADAAHPADMVVGPTN